MVMVADVAKKTFPETIIARGEVKRYDFEIIDYYHVSTWLTHHQLFTSMCVGPRRWRRLQHFQVICEA
jgi:hypothetical protein